MNLATVTLKTESFGNHVTLKHVTPAELMFLTAMYRDQVKDNPVLSVEREHEMEEGIIVDKDPTGQPIFGPGNKPVEVLGKVPKETFAALVNRDGTPWNEVQERERLCMKYRRDLVEGFYPGGIPTMPKTHEEAVASGCKTNFNGFQKDRPVF